MQSEMETFQNLQSDFAAFGYQLNLEPGDNPFVVVRLSPRRVIWHTRAKHVLFAILQVIRAERGVI